MSVQFGRWNFDGAAFAKEDREKVDAMLAAYASDDRGFWLADGICILHHGLHTTSESHREIQPHLLASGVLTWDGRLDNRSELFRELPPNLLANATDVSIVAAAYEKWGDSCFARLIGDWALALWDMRRRLLILAKDSVGLRSLYYSMDEKGVVWSTVLGPMLALATRKFVLCEEYIAGWLSHYPASDLTPYVGVHSVPPASWVQIRPGRTSISRYWDFDSSKRLVYRSSRDYEEQFRTLFAQSVRRRLRSDSPVLAQLSGGIDSSSIVCVADLVMGEGRAETPRLDTVSYYDDSEPNWNETPYFRKIEERRGRTGCHIDVNRDRSLPFATQDLGSLPGPLRRMSTTKDPLRDWIVSHGNRVLLSGEGGDEVTGGVPTAIPELSNHFARGRFTTLARSLKTWSLQQRRPWIHLFWETARTFLPQLYLRVPEEDKPLGWLHADFVKRYALALAGYPVRRKFLGALPSFQENLSTLEALRGHLGCCVPPTDPPFERRYPLLDRDFLEFLFAVPPELLLRPGRRRSLMRDALAGIVPDEILNRKRKAFVVRNPTLSIAELGPNLTDGRNDLLVVQFGVVGAETFTEALAQAKRGMEVPIVFLLRTIEMELWLRSACARHILVQGKLGKEVNRIGHSQVCLDGSKDMSA